MDGLLVTEIDLHLHDGAAYQHKQINALEVIGLQMVQFQKLN